MFGGGYGGLFGGSQGNPFEGLQWGAQQGWQQNNPSPWSGGGLGGAFGGSPSSLGGGASRSTNPFLGQGSSWSAPRAAPRGATQPTSFGNYQLQGRTQPQGATSMGGGDFAAPVDAGGIYGQQKWTGGNGIDIFVKRGSPIYAMFDGQVAPHSGGQSPMGPVPGLLLRGNNGMAAQYQHVQGVAQGPVRKGQIIGYVGDQSMDMLGQYPGMPDGYQHLDLTVGRGSGPFPLTGGDINAAGFLQQIGYRGRQIQGQTRGPGGGGGGMGMGMPGMGGMGGGMGMPGMGMGGMPGMMSPFGGGMGGGMGQMSPFGGGMGGMGGGMGGMNPFMMGMQGGMGGFGRGFGR